MKTSASWKWSSPFLGIFLQRPYCNLGNTIFNMSLALWKKNWLCRMCTFEHHGGINIFPLQFKLYLVILFLCLLLGNEIPLNLVLWNFISTKIFFRYVSTIVTLCELILHYNLLIRASVKTTPLGWLKLKIDSDSIRTNLKTKNGENIRESVHTMDKYFFPLNKI